jgi:hypothetical protein
MMIKTAKTVFLGLLFCLPFSLLAQTATVVGDWKTQIPDNTGKLAPVKLSIKSDGTFTVDFGVDGTSEIAGNYTLEGEQITIVESVGNCTDKKGIYKIVVTATTFNMNRVSDECENRGGPEGKMAFTKM